MNSLHYLSAQGPAAKPRSFNFEEKDWLLFPVSTLAIAEELEVFVVQEVMRNAAKRRPHPDNKDPVLWQVYNEWAVYTRRDIDRGIYGALTTEWYAMIEGSDRGFAEALYLCVRFKNPNWTREHVARLLSNKEDENAIWDIWMGLNHPKAPSQEQRSPPADQAPSSTESAGTSGSPPQSADSPG